MDIAGVEIEAELTFAARQRPAEDEPGLAVAAAAARTLWPRSPRRTAELRDLVGLGSTARWPMRFRGGS